MAVLIEAINKFPDDGGPENNPAGSGLFCNRLVVVCKKLSLNGCGLAEAFLFSSSQKMLAFFFLLWSIW
jgi:hypothetical protein